MEKFLDTTEYLEKRLSNIAKFDPITLLKIDDDKHFPIILQYHTKHAVSVDETVLGTIESGLLTELKSIYDLERTKSAHRL